MATTKELNAYAKAANIVEEVLSGIRTVFAFGGEKLEVERYKKHLLPAENAAKKIGLYACFGDGITRLLYFASCALSFWFGVQWVLDDRDKTDKIYTTAVLIIVRYQINHFFCLSFYDINIFQYKYNVFFYSIHFYDKFFIGLFRFFLA